MKLYYTKGACSLAVRIIINELGVESQFESVDLRAKKTESGADFLAINPKGAVPALLVDGDEVLTENVVIMQYLADKKHAMNLLPPTDDFMRYRVLEWLNYTSSEMHKTIGMLYSPLLTEDMKNAVVIPMIKNKLNYLNQYMAGKKYLLGDEFTLPDAYMTVMLMWLHYFKFDMATWPNLQNYHSVLMKRPSVQKSLQQEGLL